MIHTYRIMVLKLKQTTTVVGTRTVFEAGCPYTIFYLKPLQYFRIEISCVSGRKLSQAFLNSRSKSAIAYTACTVLCQADYAEERLDAHEEFEEELNQALYIRKMIDTGMHDRALERLMASTEARKRTCPTRLTDVAPTIFFVDH